MAQGYGLAEEIRLQLFSQPVFSRTVHDGGNCLLAAIGTLRSAGGYHRRPALGAAGHCGAARIRKQPMNAGETIYHMLRMDLLDAISNESFVPVPTLLVTSTTQPLLFG